MSQDYTIVAVSTLQFAFYVCFLGRSSGPICNTNSYVNTNAILYAHSIDFLHINIKEFILGTGTIR